MHDMYVCFKLCGRGNMSPDNYCIINEPGRCMLGDNATSYNLI